MKRQIACLLLILCVTAGPSGQSARPVSADFVFPGETATLPVALNRALGTLSARAIALHIATLASPGFEGRSLGQPGLDATAEHVAATLAGGGVGARGTRDFQQVPVREITKAAGSLTVTMRQGDTSRARTFRSGVDCLFQERPPSQLSAPSCMPVTA